MESPVPASPVSGPSHSAQPTVASRGALRTLAHGARRLLRREGRADALHEWRRRWSGAPPLPAGPIERVLVLCQGNICRSPFAAALLARVAPWLEVRSAGLETSPGKPADPQARTAAAVRWQIDLDAHRTSCAGQAELSWAQLFLVMQGWQAAEVRRRLREAEPRTRILGHYLDAAPHQIEDPFGQGDAAFLAAFVRIERAMAQLVPRLAASRAVPPRTTEER